ncbi:hypothetical protein GN956_G22987 [Arapaima gigas]
MDMFKGSLHNQVGNAIDQAATMTKQKVGTLIGDNKQQKQQQQHDKGGIGDTLSNAANKVAQEAAMKKATESAMDFGKQLFK